MTIATTASSIAYAGNGSTTAFSFAYEYRAAADLKVVLVSAANVATAKTLTTDYTVTGVSDSHGGYSSATITMVTAPASGETLTIYRKPSLVQEANIESETEPLYALNNAIDLVEYKLQHFGNRGVQLPIGSGPSVSPVLPDWPDDDSNVYFLSPTTNRTGLNWITGVSAEVSVSAALTTPLQAATLGEFARDASTAHRMTNIDALQAATWASADAPQMVILEYNHVANDGGGLFRYDSSDTSSSDNDGTIILTSTSGTNLRYKRLYSGPINVTWFGAVGDGTTNDGAAFSAANAAGAAKFVPYKSAGYNVGTTSLTVTNGESWTGEASVKLISTSTTRLFDVTSNLAIGSLIQGFTIDMTGSGASSMGVRLNNASTVSNVVIRDMQFQNCYGAIGCTGTAAYVFEIYISNIRCIYTKGLQISIPYSRGFVFLKNINIDNTLTANSRVTWGSILIEKCAGVFLEDVDVSGQANVWATQNAYTNVYDAGAIGIKIDGDVANEGFAWLRRVRCESSMGPGIVLSDFAWIHAETLESYGCIGLALYLEDIIEGNLTNVSARGAVDITGAAASSHGLTLVNCQGLQLTNVKTKNNTGNGIHCSGATCLYNTFTNIQSWDNTGYGIADATSADYSDFIGASLRNNTAGATSLSGANNTLLATPITSTSAEINMLDNAVASVSWAVAAGATNVCHLTGTLKDAAGATIAASRPLILYISEASTGIGITADAYSTGASITTGTQLIALTANKAWLVNTHTDGTVRIAITDSAKPADQYAVAVIPTKGSLSVSAASAALWGA